MGQQIHFVTGRLAERALRTTVGHLSTEIGFRYTIDVLPITVAALMTPRWVADRLRVPQGTDLVLLPGHCEGDLQPIRAASEGADVALGPRDLRDLPRYFGGTAATATDGESNIEILAEINHAPRIGLHDVLRLADQLRQDGADVIDVGCDPSHTWAEVGDCVAALRDAGHRVSIDSFQPAEIEAAARAGAELVLSVNSTNRDAAPDWGCEVVAIPDDPRTLRGLDDTVAHLQRRQVPYRIDPILEPIGCGFAASLGRYLEIGRRYPDREMLMGIGNLTELTDVDSAGINVLLLGFCQELGIHSVLTTQVINWARNSVKECDLGRRLVYQAVASGTPPKNITPALVMLRDTRLHATGTLDYDLLAEQIRDRNFRVFLEDRTLHLVGDALHLQGTDPFLIFQQLLDAAGDRVDQSHAFYLGYELAKAYTASMLGKQYEQDEPLDWGWLTQAENFHRIRR